MDDPAQGDLSAQLILPRKGEVAPKASEGEDGDALTMARTG